MSNFSKQFLITTLVLISVGIVSGVSGDSHLSLHRMIIGGDINAARELIEKSPDLNAKDERGKTPLHLAAALNEC